MGFLAALLRLLLGGLASSRNLLALLAADLYVAAVLLACHLLFVSKHIILLIAQKKTRTEVRVGAASRFTGGAFLYYRSTTSSNDCHDKSTP